MTTLSPLLIEVSHDKFMAADRCNRQQVQSALALIELEVADATTRRDEILALLADA